MTRRQLLLGGAAAGLALPGRAEADFLVDILKRPLVSYTTSRYGKRQGERGEFRHAFWLSEQIIPESVRKAVARQGKVDKSLADLVDWAKDPDPAAFTRIASLVNHHSPCDGAASGTLPAQAPIRGRYVVFSDHHLGPSRTRTNVFSGIGGRHFAHSNLGLYVAVLERYLKGGYALVENGDVEDVVVFDPALYPGEFGLRRKDAEEALATDQAGQIVPRLDQRRRKFRLGLLTDILRDPVHRDYYALLKRFEVGVPGHCGPGLYRLAGNHDHDRGYRWQDGRTSWDVAVRDSGIAEAPTGATHAPALMLLDPGGKLDTLVLHGQQFDHSSCPAHASIHGETISECLGIWYQGADRIWPWSEWCDQWAAGRPFRNVLVSGTIDRRALRANARQRTTYAYPAWADARNRLWNGSAMFEKAFEHPIAWEYLQREGDDPDTSAALVYRAALAGDAWFKYRHTEEIRVAETLAEHLHLPRLVLGHTHEPRLDALAPTGEIVRRYANSGAAGRFEGLLWALEIDDGELRLVSWSPDAFPAGHPVRRRWTAGGPFHELLLSRPEDLP